MSNNKKEKTSSQGKHKHQKSFSRDEGKKRKKGETEEKKWQPKSILQDAENGPANKKRALRRQRNSQKPNFEAVCQSKILWNELREKKCSEERRTELVLELHNALIGKYKEISMKHDASRLVQAVIQYGNEKQRISILDEIVKGGGNHFIELCRSTYAHYVIIKLIEHTRSKEGIKKICDALRGNICSLATHSVAARIIELSLMNFKTQLSSSLRLELYGREFAVFVDETLKEIKNYNSKLYEETSNNNSETKNSNTNPPISMKPTLSILLELRPTRKESILLHVSSLIGKLIIKGLLPFQYTHELLCEYLECCSTIQFNEILPSVIENSLVLLSTRPGTKVVCLAAIRGGAKERRRLLKLIKGHAAALLAHRDAYLAVMVLCEVTDDTVALQNSILAELCVVPTEEDIARNEQFSANPFLDEDDEDDENAMDEDDKEEEGDEEEEEEEEAVSQKSLARKTQTNEIDLSSFSPLLSIVLHPNSLKLLLRISSGDQCNGFLDPYELSILNIKSESSKKDDQLRRDELISFLEESLNNLVIQHIQLLLTHKMGGHFLLCFYKYISISKTSEASKEIIKLIQNNNDHDDNEDGEKEGNRTTNNNILDDAIAHSVLENIIKSEIESDESTQSQATPLSTELMLMFKSNPSLLESVLVSNRSAFVIHALLKQNSSNTSNSSTRSQELSSLLLPLRSKMNQVIRKEKSNKSKGLNLIVSILNEQYPEDNDEIKKAKNNKSTTSVKTPSKSKKTIQKKDNTKNNDDDEEEEETEESELPVLKTPKTLKGNSKTTSKSEMKPKKNANICHEEKYFPSTNVS
mmetsp:Transcript_35540/g.45834  ORF Transcript_35540/g.45834 Transcript_35540/m.45834 type:complete len:813 (+) Transcript_35540:46-2484(+)